MKEIRDMLLLAPDDQLDASMKPLIGKWDDDAKSIQILEVLDYCIYHGAASGFTVNLLQTIYDLRLKEEGITHEDNIPLATWRK